MDGQEYNDPTNRTDAPNTSYIEKRSAGMAVASMVLAIAGLAMGCCIYPAIIFGSLAVILALLSRGGEMTTGGYAKAGLILGAVAIACGILFLIYGLISLFVQFGGIEGYLDYIEEMMEQLQDPSANPFDLYQNLG